MFNKKGPNNKDFEGSSFSGEQVDYVLQSERIITLVKLAVGIIVIFVGLYLIKLGVKSNAQIELSFLKNPIKLNNAMPGTISLILGALIVIIAKQKVKQKNN